MGTLKKKLSQISKLKDRQSKGEKLTAQEMEKLEQEEDFEKELRDIESKLAAM